MSINIKKVVNSVVIVSLLALPVVGWMQRWNIYDSWRLRNYTPPGNVMQLAADTSMNAKTRRLFYVYHPVLADKTTFNYHCRLAEHTIVLGCYISYKGIYLYNVTDERLSGVQQVTAGHEVLHAAYERLSSKEKKHINSVLEDTYGKITDQRIIDTIEDYRKNGADINNELHSILGTEVRSLSAELEQYYTRYFTNRSAIVALSEKYEQAFSDRKAQAEAYLQQMNQIKAQLDALKTANDAQEADIKGQRASLEADRDNVTTTSEIQAFNARVDSYNAYVARFRQNIAFYNNLVNQYNDLLGKYNAVANEEGELIKAIDSRTDTVETQ